MKWIEKNNNKWIEESDIWILLAFVLKTKEVVTPVWCKT